MVTIRTVRPGDAPTLAYIQTESWKSAFREIVPAELLKKCTEITRAEAMYSRLLEEDKGNGYLLELDGAPHGIAWWDASREPDMPGYAELICIHSLPENRGRGYGSRMMERVLQDVQAAGYQRIMLWVFEENTPAIRFYKKHGFVPTERKQPALGAVEQMFVKEFT